MAQNISSAVMQQRSEPHESLDDFPTPSWATRALVKHVIMPNMGCFAPDARLRTSMVWEPACNRGYMARPLEEYFGLVHASDIHDYGRTGEWCQDRVVDFLYPGSEPTGIVAHGIDWMSHGSGVDWIISNPPFRLAEQFVERAWQFRTVEGIAMLVRSAFLEGVGRYERLFNRNPPSIVAQFTERVPMVKGRMDAAISTATAYCWLVWMMGEQGTRLQWIPPCRRRLERPGDYPTEDSDAIHGGEDTDGTLETAARRADREAETLCGSRAQHQEAEPVAGGPEIAADPTA